MIIAQIAATDSQNRRNGRASLAAIFARHPEIKRVNVGHRRCPMTVPWADRSAI
jgi:hypothetical protein